MIAAYAAAIDADDPLAGLRVGEIERPAVPDGWVEVEVRAAALNHHDLWSLKGFGLDPERLPMILGCDAAGIGPDGEEVVVHSVLTDPDWPGDEALDPSRTLLSELYPGALAERVSVPRQNLVPKPPSLSFEEAACLPTAYLTAYRMLFVRGELAPGQTVLVQGSAGGLPSAAIALARAAGARVWATGRDEKKRAYAEELGAHQAFETGARLPARVDVVIESVGEATWQHSLRSLEPGGKLVVAGGTSGLNPPADLARVFFKQLDVRGTTMGSRQDLFALLDLLDATGLRPRIHSTIGLSEAAEGLAAIERGEVFGKVVAVPGR